MSVAAMSIDKALLDKRLLGAALGDSKSWSTWLTVLRAAFALGLSPEEVELFNSIAGDRKPPAHRVRELWCLVGRRGGKTRVAALIACYAALFTPIRVAPGEKPLCLVLANGVDQAGLCFSYARAFLASSPVLRREIVSETQSEIRLRNGVTISVRANSFRSVRGWTVICAIFDECSFWRDETSAMPDVETYTAILPGLVTCDGMLIGISTGYRKQGLLFNKYREHYGIDDDDVLFVQGSSTVFNKTLSEAAIAKLRAADPASADSEWDATFRSDVAAFLPDDVIEDAIDYDRPLELPPQSNVSYRAFVDPSGGVGRDSYTICIGHKSGDRFIVDVIRGTCGAFNPQQQTLEYATLLKDYRVYTVVGDHYAAEWVASAWRAARPSITYNPCDIAKSAVYLESLPWWTRGLIRIPNHPKLIRELRQLERHTHRSGRDTVDHGRNGTDDHANAVCGGLRALAAHLGGLNYEKAFALNDDPLPPSPRIPERLAQYAQPPGPPWDGHAASEAARASCIKDTSEAWKAPPGARADPNAQQRESNSRTGGVFGGDTRAAAYQGYVNDLTNAWRR